MKLPWALLLLPLASAELTEEQCGSSILRQIRGAEQQAWCCALYGHCRNRTAVTAPAVPSAEVTERRLVSQDVIRVGPTIYDCKDGLNNVHLYWDVEKQAHCCAELGMGCPQHAFDCESGYMNWVHGWSPGKKIWCCKNTNRGCPPTTITVTDTRTTTSTSTFPGCQRHCTLENVQVTCQERIHFASVHTFLGEVSPCQLAHALVQRECKGLCNDCPVSMACLGAANVPTSTPPPSTVPKSTSAAGPNHDPFNCHEGLDMWQMVWFPAKQEWCCNHKGLGCPGSEKRILEDWERFAQSDPAPRAPFVRSVATWGAWASAAAVVAVAAASALRQRGERHLELQMELLE